MRPLSDWPMQVRRAIVGVFTDIDDTLTTDGAITDDALHALGQLQSAGLSVIAITGRPAGWSEAFAQQWPVDAIVAENGSVALLPSRQQAHARSVQRIYQQDAPTRAANFVRLQQVGARILREVPGAMLAKDSPGRETDIAIDHSEFSRLAPEQIAQVLRIMREEAMTATVSSIHINGWFGAHHKLSGAQWIVHALLGRDLRTEAARWAYVGDSTNDQIMFEAFDHSIGVANLMRFAAELQHWPRYLTQGERGAGFAEFAQALLTAREARPTP